MKKNQSEHCKYAPSSADRWLKCPFSISDAYTGKKFVYQDKTAANKGTAMHELCAEALEKYIAGETYESVLDKATTTLDRNIISSYVEYVSKVAGTSKDIVIYVEHRLSTMLFGVELWGTADAVVYNSKTQELHIIDLKTGGIFVPSSALQLRIYALLAVDTLVRKGQKVSEIYTHIFQPTTEGLSRMSHWTWKEISSLVPKIQEAIDASIDTPDKQVAGAHCIWCPKGLWCDAFLDKTKDSLAKAFKVFMSYQGNIERLTEDDLVAFEESRLTLEKMMREVKNYIKKRVIDDGGAMGRLRIVEKQGARKWDDEVSAAEVLVKAGLGEDILHIASPASVDKILELKGDDQLRSMVQKFISRKTGSQVVKIVEPCTFEPVDTKIK